MTTRADIDAFIRRVNARAHRWGLRNDRLNRGLRLADYIAKRAQAREALPMTAYVSSDGKCITTWPGSAIGTVDCLVSTIRKVGRDNVYCYRATVFGRRYHGRGLGPGMVLNLYPSKAGAR